MSALRKVTWLCAVISPMLTTDIVTPYRYAPVMGVTNSTAGRFAFAAPPDCCSPAPPQPGTEAPPEKPAPDPVKVPQ
jgi:hypothetical protein